ncbi:hypothetical protein V1509DRAFT_619262 [Lipomyces kononenkoae]
MATQNSEPLIPPVVSIPGLPPLPPPSDPPTKDDVDRALVFKNMVEATLTSSRHGATEDDVAKSGAYYVRLRKKYERSLGLGDITLADAVLEFRRLFAELRESFDQRMDSFDQRMDSQVEMTGLLVQNMVSGRTAVVETYRNQATTTNRLACERNRSGVEVPFLDGTLPSSLNLAALKSAADIGRLNANQARALAAGHGFGDLRGVAEIKDRLRVELGFSGMV